jgi:hypothetical protein
MHHSRVLCSTPVAQSCAQLDGTHRAAFVCTSTEAERDDPARSRELATLYLAVVLTRKGSLPGRQPLAGYTKGTTNPWQGVKAQPAAVSAALSSYGLQQRSSRGLLTSGGERHAGWLPDEQLRRRGASGCAGECMIWGPAAPTASPCPRAAGVQLAGTPRCRLPCLGVPPQRRVTASP